MSGYARIHRSLIGHPAFRNDAEAMALAYMVLRASWKPTLVRYKGRVVELDRGQLVTSIRDLSKTLDRDRTWIGRFLKSARSFGLLSYLKVSGVVVITVTDFEQYEPTAGQEPDWLTLQYAPAQSLDARETISTALRVAVAERDCWTCRYCGGGGPFHVDHVIPWSRGGRTTLDNLVLACVPCNLSKGARTPEEWRA